MSAMPSDKNKPIRIIGSSFPLRKKEGTPDRRLNWMVIAKLEIRTVGKFSKLSNVLIVYFRKTKKQENNI